jgi:uncharacterized protein (TIGR02453 family)
LFKFLSELAQNNSRPWFEENKDRYEADVRGPLLALIQDFEIPLKKLSPHFDAVARKVGGSLFRIHRDVRFAKDKSPFKTNAGVHFRHEQAKDAHAPGYYLHLEPRASFIGVGIWHPDTATARTIRGAIMDDPQAWGEAISGTFGETFALAGDALKRPPVGVAADHPCVEDLMRKDWIGVVDVSQRTLCGVDFIDRFAQTCDAATPFMRFLATALELRF